MSGEEALTRYSQYLTPYERDEIKTFDHVYYLNLSANRKAYILNNPKAFAVPVMHGTNVSVSLDSSSSQQ